MIQHDHKIKGANVLVLGVTFKENCPDCRNTKVVDICKELADFGCNVDIYDPWADPQVVKHEYDIEVTNDIPMKKYDAVVLAVAHEQFDSLDVSLLAQKNSVIFDVKGFYDKTIVDGRL